MLKLRNKDWTITRPPDRIGIDLRFMGRGRKDMNYLDQRRVRRVKRREVVDWLRGVWR